MSARICTITQFCTPASRADTIQAGPRLAKGLDSQHSGGLSCSSCPPTTSRCSFRRNHGFQTHTAFVSHMPSMSTCQRPADSPASRYFLVVPLIPCPLTTISPPRPPPPANWLLLPEPSAAFAEPQGLPQASSLILLDMVFPSPCLQSSSSDAPFSPCPVGGAGLPLHTRPR